MQPDTPATTVDTAQPPPDVAAPADARWALAFALVAGFLLIVMAVPALSDAIKPADDWFWELAVANEYSAMVALAELLAVVGGTVSMIALTAVGAIALAWLRRWSAMAVWLLVFTLATALNAAIKAIYQRPRPPLGLTQEDTWSFASGHSLTAAVIVVMLLLVWVPADRRRRGLLIVGTVYALAMAASRVYLRAHWFTDVVAGLAIGATTALVLVYLARWWTARSGRSRSSAGPG